MLRRAGWVRALASMAPLLVSAVVWLWVLVLAPPAFAAAAACVIAAVALHPPRRCWPGGTASGPPTTPRPQPYSPASSQIGGFVAGSSRACGCFVVRSPTR